MRVIVTGLLASYPLGGLAWHYLHYLLGVKAMGHQVFYLEDTGNWMYDPVTGTFTDQIIGNVQWVENLGRTYGFDGQWAVRDPGNRLYGCDEARLAEVIRATDVLLNVSGSCWLRDEYRTIPRKVYIDTDPGYNHVRANIVQSGGGDDSLKYSVARMAMHNAHFTYALNVDGPDCRLPATPFNWRPTVQPIALAHWPPAEVSNATGAYTTVMSWNPYAKPLTFEGASYGGKEERLRLVIGLPKQVDAQFELAISGQPPRGDLSDAGWATRTAESVSATPQAFRDYVEKSRAEFSVAKDIYVRMRTGWFGDRSAGYLAAGRPVVVEDTGLGRHLPVGTGILCFRDLTEAAQAVEAVESNYLLHASAAREIAVTHFAPSVVLQPLLG